MAGTCGLCHLTCWQGLGHCCKIKYINMSATKMYEIVTLSRASEDLRAGQTLPLKEMDAILQKKTSFFFFLRELKTMDLFIVFVYLFL